MCLVLVLYLLSKLSVPISTNPRTPLQAETSDSEYKEWRSPRDFASDEGFIGKTFWEQFSHDGRKEDLINLATRIWQAKNADKTPRHDPITLNDEEVIYGKNNIICRLHMPDGSAWAARLHNSLKRSKVITDETERLRSERLLFESEIATMVWLQKTTNIPIPKIYGWDPSYENDLGTPYMIIAFINGRTYPYPLITSDNRIRDKDLQHIHNQLTSFAWQLAQHPFPLIGRLRFTDPSDPTSEIVVGEMVDRLDKEYGPLDTSQSLYIKQTTEVLKVERAKAKGAPTESLQSAELFAEAAEHTGKVMNHGPFFLQHPDLHWQNMLLDDELNVVAIIDWEWAHTTPVEGFNILPWNGAAQMLPVNPGNVDRHARNAATFFKTVAERSGFGVVGEKIVKSIIDVQQSPQRVIVECLQEYKFPGARRRLYDKLRIVIDEIERE